MTVTAEPTIEFCEHCPVEAETVTAGIRDAMDVWLAERSVTVPACIVEAVREAVSDWLDDNGAAVIAALGSVRDR